MVNRTNSFPAGWRELAAYQAKLKSGNLTLNEVREIQDRIIENTTDKTQDLAEALFEQLEPIAKALRTKRAGVSKEVLELSQKVMALEIQWNRLAPQKIAAELVSLINRAALIPKDEELPSWIQEIHQIALKQLERGTFKFHHPTISELDLQSLEPTFATRLQAVAEKIRQENSLLPFQRLDPSQQKEILRHTTAEGV